MGKGLFQTEPEDCRTAPRFPVLSTTVAGQETVTRHNRGGVQARHSPPEKFRLRPRMTLDSALHGEKPGLVCVASEVAGSENAGIKSSSLLESSP